MASIHDLDTERLEKIARFNARQAKEREERERSRQLEPEHVRARIALGMRLLDHLLDRLPRGYVGPYATERDLTSPEALEAFLARPDVVAAIKAARPMLQPPRPRPKAEEPPIPAAAPDGPTYEHEEEFA